jgi:cysteine desulfurase
MIYEMIYLDNNATTLMSVEARKSMVEWCNKGNPSAGYASARSIQAMMADFRKYLTTIIPGYTIIFTSGASESNCTILQSVAHAYRNTHSCGHVILSAIEHRSLLDTADFMATCGLITVSYVQPTSTGHILPKEVEAMIRPNTCLISIMHANNEIGSINDVNAIARLAHARNIPFHTDAVQTFGKIPPTGADIDAMSMSFHKFGGPPGIGILAIRPQLISGYKLHAMISGTQNYALRGGTENVPGISSAFTATKLAFVGRAQKNTAMAMIKKYIIAELSARIPVRTYTDYLKTGLKQQPGPRPSIEIILLSQSDCLMNTILLSIVKRSPPLICNAEIKKKLEARGIIVSVGSACNTASTRASHVLYAMYADELIRKGTLRISLGDDTTHDDAKKFIQELLRIIASA